MKATHRLRFSFGARATRLALLFAMLVVWSVVVLALLPRDSEMSSAPREDRTSPALPSSIPASPVSV